MRYGQWVIRNRWAVIAASLLLIFFSSYGMRTFTFENDNRVFFSPESPRLLALDELEATYNRLDVVIFVIEAESGDVFTKETLMAVEELTAKGWLFPYSSRVDSITNFQHTEVSGDELIVENLVPDASSLTDAAIERVRRIALNEAALVDRLVSGRGHTTAVNIVILKPADGDIIPEVSAHTAMVAEEFERANPDLNLYIAGGVPFDAAIGKVTQSDIERLIPMMLVVMVFFIYISFRSVSATVATVLVIVASALTAMGLAGWVGMKLNSGSAMAPIIILTLAVADSVHVLSTMFGEMRSGKTREDAIVESFRVNLQPVFLTSITTAIGFLSMNFSDAPPFHDLGNIVAVGVMAAFLYSILLLPALMSFLPLSRKIDARCMCSHTFAGDVGDFVVRRKAVLLPVMSVVMVVCAFGITKIELNDNFVKYFDESVRIRRDADFIQKNLTGLDIIDYSLPAAEAGGINEPEYLEKVERFARWWEDQAGIVHVNTVTDIYKRLNRDMHGGDEDFYKIPDTRELAAQYMLLYEMSLPFGLDLGNNIDVDRSATRLTAILGDTSAAEQRILETLGNDWREENAPEWQAAKATGLSLMFAHISETNINGMLRGTSVALVLISGILLVALRSVKIGVLSLVPNLAPAFMAFGMWGLVVGNVGIAVAVVSALSLGIVVDDTVHFLSKYLRAKRELGVDPAEAVRYSFRHVGAAIISTSVILVAGFMVLATSNFGVNSSMGLLTAIAIGFALLADFLFLPPLLIKIDKRAARGE